MSNEETKPNPTAPEAGSLILKEIAEEWQRLDWLANHPYLFGSPTWNHTFLLLECTKTWMLGQDLKKPSDLVRQRLLSALEREEIRHCYSCGCTDDYACPGGCSWVNVGLNLCTACQDRIQRRHV